MKQAILVLATVFTALLILRQQNQNLLWEAMIEQERMEAAMAMSAAAEEAEAEAERQVLTAAQRERLDTYLSEQEGNWSVYLKDLTTGESYCYNGEALYYPASLLKAPYAYWIALKADAGELKFSQKIPNTKYGALAGGDMEKYNTSKTIPVMAVLHSMIAHSNNDAVTLLASHWEGTKENGFVDFLTELGYTYADTVRVDGITGIQGMITVEDIGATMEALYAYFESDSPNAYDLKRCFTASPHQLLYVPEGVLAAKKYGSWQYAYHDAAIVYEEYPYILCVMSDRGLEEVDFPEEPTKTMQALGRMVNEMLNG